MPTFHHLINTYSPSELNTSRIEPISEKTGIPCSNVLLPVGGLFLSVSRKNNHNDLGFAGGKLDEGETYEECAIREVLEETGFHIRLLPISPYEGTYLGLYCKTYLGELLNEPREDISEAETGKVMFTTKARIVSSSFGVHNAKAFAHFGY